MKLLIVRHGEPDYSIDSLTEKGWREARLLADRLVKTDIAAMYVSPLGRARDTAKPTLEKLDRTAETCEFLREFPAYATDAVTGDRRIPWDLLPRYWTDYPELYDREKWTDSPAWGENNVAAVAKTVYDGLDGILARHGYERHGNYYRATRSNHDTVILFCHFGVECVLLGHLLNISPVSLWHGTVALPSSVTELVTEEREEGIAYFRMMKFGDLSHLYAADEPESFYARWCECFTDDTRH